jgi:SNF2 family DNA or RNA helicase
MIEINWQRCRIRPFDHQRIGTRELVASTNPATGRVIPNVFLLADQVGAGKSKQLIDAVQFVYDAREIDTVVVVTPGFARSVWGDPDPVLGEVAKHSFVDARNVIHEYSALKKATETISLGSNGLQWIVTNYEFIRREARLDYLIKALKGRRVWLVLDESWMIKTFTSENAKASRRLRRHAIRATLLNGSPVDGSPVDLYSQMNFLDPRILSVNGEPMTFTYFKARYTITVPIQKRNGQVLKSARGYTLTQTVGYQNLEELAEKVKPYILQRKTRDCIDLPEALPPVRIEAKMSDAEWKAYCSMRDDMVTWLGSSVSTARQAIVKSLRLAQITSGFLGGFEDCELDPFSDNDAAGHDVRSCEIDDCPDCTAYYAGLAATQPKETLREIGRSKLDALVNYVNDGLGFKPDRLLTWSRFRPALERMAAALESECGYRVFKLQGGQSKDERRAAKLALAPETVVDEPTAVAANTQAGGASLNFTGAGVAIYESNDFSLLRRNQSKGRIDRPGQKNRILYVDVLAVGPKGQKTIDHQIVKALDNKENIAEWTTSQWRDRLLEE